MDKFVNEEKRRRQRIVVGISGATGIIYGIRALQMLRELDIETHLVVSRAGEMTRAADVALKERRRLVMMVREAPLHGGHIRNMLTVTESGGIIHPPVPAFY